MSLNLASFVVQDAPKKGAIPEIYASCNVTEVNGKPVLVVSMPLDEILSIEPYNPDGKGSVTGNRTFKVVGTGSKDGVDIHFGTPGFKSVCAFRVTKAKA